MSVLQKSPTNKESNAGSKERQTPTLDVRFTEVSVLNIKSQMQGVKKGRDQL